MTPELCNLTEFAKLTGYDPKWIDRLIKDGMPAERPGRPRTPIKIVPADAIRWMLGREKNKRSPETGRKSLEAERLRLVAEQADREALDNARKRAEVIDYEVAEELVTSMASLLSSRLDGIGGRLANDLVNEPNPAVIRDKILSECRAIREAIAETAGELGQRYQSMRNGAADNSPAAEQDTGSVGGRKQSLTEG